MDAVVGAVAVLQVQPGQAQEKFCWGLGAFYPHKGWV